MKIHTYTSEEEWLEDRKGRITGTKLKDIGSKRGGGEKKIGFYQLIADRLAIDEEGDEDPMDRGHRLEEIAVDFLSAETRKKFLREKVIWFSEENESIACSPDGYTENLQFAAEVKALKAALHIQAWHTKKVPSEYKAQSIQPFIVNNELKRLYFCFIDPRVVAKPFFYLEINRKDVQKDIDKYKELQINELKEVDEIVAQLAF